MLPVPDSNPHHPHPSIPSPYVRGPLGEEKKGSVQHRVKECGKHSPYKKRLESICEEFQRCMKSEKEVIRDSGQYCRQWGGVECSVPG